MNLGFPELQMIAVNSRAVMLSMAEGSGSSSFQSLMI